MGNLCSTPEERKQGGAGVATKAGDTQDAAAQKQRDTQPGGASQAAGAVQAIPVPIPPRATTTAPQTAKEGLEPGSRGGEAVNADDIAVKEKSVSGSKPSSAPEPPPAAAPMAPPTPASSTSSPTKVLAQPASEASPSTAPTTTGAAAAPAAAPAPPKAQADKDIESKLRTDCKLRDVYKIGRELGRGGFSIVKLVSDKATNKEYACKIMALPPVGQEVGENENTRDDIFKEIDLLCGMNHPNVIFLKEYFEEGNKVYLITELLTGGELLEAVLKRGSYTEDEARLCFVQVLRGIEYLHSKNVVHRDLKLENLLLSKQDDISLVKIADFGLAKHAVNGMQTICGTPQYVAPEVIVGQKGHMYGPGVDMWSAGVVLYILLGGYPPFWSDNEPQLFDMIRKGKYNFDDPIWQKITDSAKDLIRKLLVVDPSKRLSASEALEHEFIMKGNFPPAPPPPDRF